MRVGCLVTSTTVVCIKVSGDLVGIRGVGTDSIWDCCKLRRSDSHMQQLAMPYLHWLYLLAYQWHIS